MKFRLCTLSLCCLVCCLPGACSTSRNDRPSAIDTRRGVSVSARRAGEESEKAVESHQGKASWYSTGTNGTRTASGEPLSDSALTAAHRTLPFGTRVRVINTSNGQKVVVRITDRGPFRKSRIIDLSLEAAKRIDMINAGEAPVRVEVLR